MIKVILNECINPKDYLTSNLNLVKLVEEVKKYAKEKYGYTDKEVEKIKTQTISSAINGSFYGENYFCKERIKEAIRLISKFVKSEELSVEGLCTKEGITKADLEEFANVIRYTKPKLYKEYKDKLNIKSEPKKYSKKELEIQEYCYQLLIRNNWSTNNISKDIALTVPEIRKNALDYATNTLGMSADEFYYDKYFTGKEEKELNCSVNKRIFVLFEELSDIDIEEKDKIKDVMNKYYSEYNRDNISYLRQKIYNYNILHRLDDYDIDSDLKEKIKVYVDEHSKRKKKQAPIEALSKNLQKTLETKMPEVEEFFIGYLNSSFPNFMYREINKESATEYNKKRSMLKNNNPELYQLVEEKKEKDHLKAIEIAKRIAALAEDNKDFDLFDYYHYAEGIYAKSMELELRGEDLGKVKAVICVLAEGEKVLYNDEEKQMIKNAGRSFMLENGEQYVVTEEEKQMAYDYIESHEFPFSAKLFKKTLKRCINNRLYEYDNQSKKKR